MKDFFADLDMDTRSDDMLLREKNEEIQAILNETEDRLEIMCIPAGEVDQLDSWVGFTNQQQEALPEGCDSLWQVIDCKE